MSAAQRGFPLHPDDKRAMQAFWAFYESRRADLIADLQRAFAAASPEMLRELDSTVAVEQAQQTRDLQEQAILDDRWDDYREALRVQGELYADAGVGYSAWMWRTAAFRDAVRRHAAEVVRADATTGIPKATTIVDGLLCLIDVTLDGLLTGFIAAKERRVARSEERYRAMFDKSPLPMWMFDRETLRFVDVNQAAIGHYGYAREEWLAMTLRDIRPAEEVPAMLHDVGRPAETMRASTWRHRKKDGSVITVEITATDFVVHDRPVRLVLANDVTEREQAQRSLRATEDRLRQAQKMEAIGQMAGGIAHDFNNVLTVVDSYATLLEESLDADDRRRGEATEIRRAVERAGGITHQLLAMSRQRSASPRPIRLDDVVAEFAPMLRRIVGEQIAVTVRRGDVPAVMADPVHLDQVLMNLAVNARDAMPAGGRLTIETRGFDADEEDPRGLSPGRHVVLAVTDTGTGMDAETQRRIFDPFFTTKGTQGTGLGLSIVHGIVLQAGGVISVYSKPGQGTTFSIYLPVTAEAEAPQPSAARDAPRTLPPSTVLVVDDDPDVCEVAARILRAAGCHVLTAASADEARRVCVTHDGTIDVVMLDLVLSDGRGDEVAEQLRALRPSTAVVLVSGYSAAALSAQGGPLPDLLPKPYSPAALRAAVARALATRDEVAAPRAQPRTARTAAAPSVLLVEDEVVLAAAITHALRASGCTVIPVSGGSAAMAELETRHFDVVLSDVYMPGVTGVDLLRGVRRLDLDVPVILMSGTPTVEIATKAIELGAFRYLTKPFDFDELTKLVHHAARAHALARLRRDAFSLKGVHAGAADRAGLEVRFDQAIEGLRMVFQPIVDARTSLPFGVEALVRSSEPSMPSPLQLLEAATQLGQLTRLGRQVRVLSAAALAPRTDALNLFINLHPDDLADVDLVAEEAPLTRIASRVILEVTERAALTSSPALRARLEQLRRLGFRLAVDDIGAGYSGLTSFTELAPEIVKIDMSLVRDVQLNALKQRTIEALCRLCHEVGTLVVAEGVETTDERDCLVHLGCDLLQGYLIARPGPVVE